MAKAETGTGAFLGAVGGHAQTASSRSHRFVAEIFDGADEALAALEVIQDDVVSGGLQTLDWLTVLYEELADPRGALPRLVVVTNSETGKVVLAFPLVVSREGLLRIAGFPDFGVADCGAPILGAEPLTDNAQIRRAWRSVRTAMRDIDLIRLERMPGEIGGRPNPLVSLFGTAPSHVSSHSLDVRDGFEAYLQRLGKKYRKDFERCHRLWMGKEHSRLYRAATHDEIAHVFATLEEQQAIWHAANGTKDMLANSAMRSFYERLAIDGGDAGLTALFALEAGGRTVATLFGLVHDGVFTLLAISTGGEDWSHLSPGRLVVLETVRYFAERGVKRFDMGVNSNPLKHGFGTEEVPLYDLVVAQDVAALPKAIKHELTAHLQGGRLRAALKKAIPRLGS